MLPSEGVSTDTLTTAWKVPAHKPAGVAQLSGVGYVDQSGVLYTNKYDAITQAWGGSSIRFYFYEDVFDAMNWGDEPTATLPELYRARALQLRDRYDHLVLAYSGGIDSTNMLEAFILNGIKVDEVLMVGAFSQDAFKGSDENHNRDIYANVIPTLADMDLRGAKLTYLDYSPFLRQPAQLDVSRSALWLRDIGPYISPHNFFWYELYKHITVDRAPSQRVGVIMGCDKPRIVRRAGKYFFYFLDTGVLGYGRVGFSPKEGVDIANFYSSPETGDLLRKQAAVCKRYIIAAESTLRHVSLDAAVYDVRHPLIHTSVKTTSTLISERDSFFRKWTGSDVAKLYCEGLIELQKKGVAGAMNQVAFSRLYEI